MAIGFVLNVVQETLLPHFAGAHLRPELRAERIAANSQGPTFRQHWQGIRRKEKSSSKSGT